MPGLCKDANLDAYYTNHSLRATAITRMYKAGVAENIFSEKSGHRGIKGLRAYEKTSITQEKIAGAVINATVDLPTTLEVKARPSRDLEDNTDMKPSFKLPTFSGLQNCTLNFYSA